MIVEGLCFICKASFDSHWHLMPIGQEKCPRCGAGHEDLAITTDEENDDQTEIEEED